VNIAPLLGFAIAVTLASCAATGDRCSNAPVGNVNAFFAGGEPSRDVAATVATMAPLAELEGFRYEMTDGSRLTWIAKEPIPALEIGRTYRFVVDYSPGSPDASGILIFDGERLLFAALTDQRPFQHVLREGVPRFTISTGDPACRSRGRTKCHEALVNLPLTIDHAGERKVLYQGERLRMGEFEIHALTAQKVTYASRCADAGLAGVSFTIQRAN
jgi:hypothetical protein